MDWYYPCSAACSPATPAGPGSHERWDTFVMDGRGVRCVSDRPWVTAAETSECAMALDASGSSTRAGRCWSGPDHLRDDDGAYWTGCVHPQCVRFPGGERTTYTAAAVLLADDVLDRRQPAAGLFRGDTLPAVLDLPGAEERVAEA